MAKVWADFHDWILPEVQGCPVAVVNHTLRDVLIDFYDQTGLLVYAQSPISVVADTATYSLTPPANYEVSRIEELMLGDLRLFPVSQVQLAQMYFNWQTISGPPQYYFCETTDSFRLVPVPAEAPDDTIQPRVVLTPSRACSGISEDWIYDGWVNVLAAGTLARLMRMPGKPWTDLQRAVIYQDQFRSGMTAARSQADRGQSGAVLSVRLKRFF